MIIEVFRKCSSSILIHQLSSWSSWSSSSPSPSPSPSPTLSSHHHFLTSSHPPCRRHHHQQHHHLLHVHLHLHVHLNLVGWRECECCPSRIPELLHCICFCLSQASSDYINFVFWPVLPVFWPFVLRCLGEPLESIPKGGKNNPSTRMCPWLSSALAGQREREIFPDSHKEISVYLYNSSASSQLIYINR